MPSPRLGRWRAIWFNTHLVLGVGLTVLLAPLGLTGSVLVWRQALSQPAGVSGPVKLPLASYAAVAAQAAGGKVSAVRLPANGGAAVAVVVRTKPPAGAAPGGRPSQATVWLDPATGRVLRMDTRPGGVLGPIHELHETFMVGDAGGVVVGICGFAMLVSSLTGLWLWWPRLGSFLGGLAWKRTSWTLLNLHYLGGFWLCVPLAMLSLTGALLAFPQLMGQAPGGPGGPPGQRGGGDGHPVEPAAIDAVANAALARHAGARLTSITLPGGDGAWRLQLTPPSGDPLSLRVDAAGVESAAPAPGGDPLRRLVHRLHGGEQTGIIWQLWITLAGLAPTLLGATGVIVWLRRRKAKAG